MTATGHAIIGTVIAAKIGNPYFAIPLAIASHLAADFFPHWDVATNSRKKSRARLNFDTFADVTTSFFLSYLLLNFLFPQVNLTYAFIVIIASQSWDWVTGPYYFWGWNLPPFNWTYRFQKIFDRRLDKPWGIINQAAILLFLIILAKITTPAISSNTAPKTIIYHSNTPTPIPTPSLKSYTNTKYGFTFEYPIKGITQKENIYSEVDCGNAIKENGNEILVDNLFKIQILNWTQSLDDYLISRGSKTTYEFEPISSNMSTESAVKVIGIKKGLELASIGYPPLMNVNAIYKKSNNLFLIINFENPTNEGCINPKELDYTKYEKYIDQNWSPQLSF